MGFRLPVKTGAATALAMLLLLFLAPIPAGAAGDAMIAAQVYTTVHLNDRGGGHVDQHLIITDITDMPIATGSLTLDLQRDNALLAGLLSDSGNCHDISVTRQDGTPVEFALKTSGGNVQLQIFSPDLLMTNWNTQFIVSYDMDDMTGNNLLTREFWYSGGLSGVRLDSSELTVVLPEGSHVTYASSGASVNGNSVTWMGAGDIALEYSGLPLPSAPVPLQYLFWGGLLLVALGWCFKPHRLIWGRTKTDEIKLDGDAAVGAPGTVPDGGDRLDRK